MFQSLLQFICKFLFFSLLLLGRTAEGSMLFFKSVTIDPTFYVETSVIPSVWSRIQCGSNCMVQSNFATCTAFHYDEAGGQQRCSCGKLVSFGGWNTGPELSLRVNGKCDRPGLLPGKSASKQFCSYLQTKDDA